MREPTTLKRGTPEQVGMDPARIELIRERARGWVATGDTPSLVLLVARKGVIVLEEAYGILRPSDNAPVQTDSIFPVMSITKPVTAAAIMCLVDDGLLSLKHPITDLIPEITAPGTDQVLVADLLTHTSGYDDVVVNPHREQRRAEQQSVPPPAPGQDPDTSRLIHYAADAPLSKAPGEAAIYSNFNYELLGDIVSRVTRVSLAQYVESRIFEPLGAKDSFLVLPKELRENRRVFRQPGNLDLPQLYPWWPSIDAEASDNSYTGANGLKSTARDIGTFAQMLLNGGAYGARRVLSAAAVRAMTSPQWPPGIPAMYSLTDPNTGANVYYPVRGGNWGYGLFLLTADDRAAYINGSLSSPRSFGHTGALGSYFWADPEADIVAVYLSVVPRPLPNGNQFFWRADYFQNMVHASVID